MRKWFQSLDRRRVFQLLDNVLTVLLLIVLSLNIVIFILNKVALNFIGGE